MIGLLEPPGTGLIQNLSFEGDSRQNTVECAQAICGNQSQSVFEQIGIADFSGDFFSPGQAGFSETIINLFFYQIGIIIYGHSDNICGQLGYKGCACQEPAATPFLDHPFAE